MSKKIECATCKFPVVFVDDCGQVIINGNFLDAGFPVLSNPNIKGTKKILQGLANVSGIFCNGCLSFYHPFRHEWNVFMQEHQKFLTALEESKKNYIPFDFPDLESGPPSNCSNVSLEVWDLV